jgi:hypothetical protein
MTDPQAHSVRCSPMGLSATASRRGAACKALVPFGRPGGH